MARCGCAENRCTCVFDAGPGIDIGGTGNPEQPARIGVRISPDPGNCLRIDSQGRLYGPCDESGELDRCGVSVEGLPEDHLVIGRGGAGRLLAADHTMRSLTRALDLSLPAVHIRCRPLSDGTPVAYPALSIRSQSGKFPQAMDGYWPEMPNDHADYLIPNLTASAYKTMPIYAGWRRDLHVERSSTVEQSQRYNDDNLGGRWGFFGFGESQSTGGLTLAEVLTQVGRRTVVLIEIDRPTDRFLDLVLGQIRSHCVQDSCIVSSSDPADLQPFIDEPIGGTMLWCTDEEVAASNPPAQLVSQGVTWVQCDKDLSDATISGYTSAGLNVTLATCTRHHEWDRVDSLGCRGVLSDDPQYMLGFDDPTVHRMESGHASLRHHGVLPGQLSWRTDLTDQYYPPWSRGEKFMGWGPDGSYTGATELMPPMSASDAQQWVDSSDPISQRVMHGYGILSPRTVTTSNIGVNGVSDILAGWLCPIPEPESYAIEYQVSFCTDPGQNGRNIGIFFGLENDKSFPDQLDDGASFWHLSFQWNSEMVLRRWENGDIAEEESVDTEETVGVGAWYRFRVIVDASEGTVTAQRVQLGGEIRNTITMNGDGVGEYFQLYKNELGGDEEYYIFTAGWRQLLVQSPFEGQDPEELNPDGSYPWELGGEDEDDPDEGDDVEGLVAPGRVSRLQRVPMRGEL